MPKTSLGRRQPPPVALLLPSWSSAYRGHRGHHVCGSDHTSELKCVFIPTAYLYHTALLGRFCELGLTRPPPHGLSSAGIWQRPTRDELQISDYSQEEGLWDSGGWLSVRTDALVRCATTMAVVASASLAWATSSRLARASTLPEPGRSNTGVCDRGRLPCAAQDAVM